MLQIDVICLGYFFTTLVLCSFLGLYTKSTNLIILLYGVVYFGVLLLKRNFIYGKVNATIIFIILSSVLHFFDTTLKLTSFILLILFPLMLLGTLVKNGFRNSVELKNETKKACVVRNSVIAMFVAICMQLLKNYFCIQSYYLNHVLLSVEIYLGFITPIEYLVRLIPFKRKI
jgi:hypothetical protein